MKRSGRLIEHIADWENLLVAYGKARKGKTHRKEVVAYDRNLHNKLRILQQQFLSGRVRVGNYHFFKVYDPKERQICAASFDEQVMQHALMNVCGPVFERQQLFESFATRKDKGTLAAIQQARRYAKTYPYFIKMDIRKYFDSIEHGTLQHKLRRKFKDPHVLNIFDRIIGSYRVEEGRGVPIGNLSSQYFANYYLAFFDRFVKQELRVPGYVRYMDDMLLFHRQKEYLLSSRIPIQEFLRNELGLDCKHLYVNRCDQGIPFLGFRVFPNRILLNARSRNRYRSKLEAYTKYMETGIWTEAEFADRMRAVTAFTRFGHSLGYRRNCLRTAGGFVY